MDNFVLYNSPLYYDIAFSYDIKHEMQIYERIFNSHVPFKVNNLLEPACGTGRFLVAFPGRGIKITGYDLSDSFVKYANLKIVKSGFKDFAKAVTADMKTAKFDRVFDSAFTPINSIGYLLKDEDIICHFRNTASSVKKGGVYVIHLDCYCNNPENEKSFSEWECSRDGISVNIKWGFARSDLTGKLSHQKCIMKIEDRGNVKEIEDNHILRLWLYEDLKDLIKRSECIELIAIYNEDFTGIPPESEITGEMGNLYYVLKVI